MKKKQWTVETGKEWEGPERSLREDLDDIRYQVLKLLFEDLVVIETLREFMPATRRHVLARLENALRLIERLKRAVAVERSRIDARSLDAGQVIQ